MNNETIKDIVTDIRNRNQGQPLDGESSHSLVEDMLRLADRIEAAYKHEADGYKGRIKLWSDRADELRRKCDEQYAELKRRCDGEKLREALKKIAEISDNWYYGVDTSKSSEDVVIACGQLAETALCDEEGGAE